MSAETTTLGNRDFADALPIAARVTEHHLVVSLADGRQISTPLAWYPTLLAAPAEQRTRFELSPFGIHWPELDEDLSIDGMLRGETAVEASPAAA